MEERSRFPCILGTECNQGTVNIQFLNVFEDLFPDEFLVYVSVYLLIFGYLWQLLHMHGVQTCFETPAQGIQFLTEREKLISFFLLSGLR
jgi:hypothetical protein